MREIKRLLANHATWLGFHKVSPAIGIIGLLFIGGIWYHFLTLIDYEYQQDIKAAYKAETNLMKAFDGEIRGNFKNIDEVLAFTKGEFAKNGRVSSETLTRLHSLQFLPVMHISVLNETGTVTVSSSRQLLKQDRSFREYFRKHQAADSPQLLISKAVSQKLPQGEGPLTFHLSYRLNKPDGSFGGVVAAAVNPVYFTKWVRQMSLAQDTAITILDLDGNVLARQKGDEFSAGMNVAGSELFKQLQGANQGSYTTVSAVDHISRIVSYVRMADYPIVLLIAERKAEVLEPFYQRRHYYYWSAGLASLFLIGACWLLILMVQALRKANERLELRVAERTRQIQSVNDQLARSNAELEQFAYVASHDLQEPLRMISGYVQLLARRYKGKLDHDADEFIEFAVDGANRMQGLINDLLLYSRVNSRKREFEATDCKATVKQILTDLQLAIEDNQAEIQVADLPTVMADPAQLGQVFQNLIGNALKYHGAAPPRIAIGAERTADEWVFSVQDNGIGIAPEFFERIFIMFQRLHNRTEYSGTGIGLALCKKIIERHGGRIWVESAPGRGATFFFTIPVKGVKP